MQLANEAFTAISIKGTTSGQGTANSMGVLCSGVPAVLGGIFVPGALTAQVVQLWTGTAGNTSSGLPIVSTMTLAANAFYRIPGYFASGIQFWVSNENVNLTFFYCPASSG